MLLHEFGEDLVLALELLLKVGDPPVLVVACASGAGLERGRGVLEELLLPAVEHRGVDAVLVTQIRDRGVFEEVKPQNVLLQLKRDKPSARISYNFERRFSHAQENPKALHVPGEGGH